MVWRFEPAKRFSEALDALDWSVREHAEAKIRKILENPYVGKPNSYARNGFSVRFFNSKYRMAYRLDGDAVRFLKVGKRDNVYDD